MKTVKTWANGYLRPHLINKTQRVYNAGSN